MEYFDEKLKLVVNFGFQERWITENEKMQIITKETLDLKKMALMKILTNTKCDEGAVKLLLALRSIEEMNLTPYSDSFAEHLFLSILMPKLSSKGLVTEEQQLIYKDRLGILKNKLEKEELKHWKKQKEGTVKWKIKENQNRDNRYPTENNTHPMLIHLVINCVLQCVNINEVKNARCISKVWSSVGLDVLKSRSKIVFSQTSDADSDFTDYDWTPTNFLSVFPIESQETVPFTTFKFRDHNRSKPWLVEEIDYFFRNQKKHIKELEFDDVNLIKEKGFPAYNQDYSLWLTDSAMTKINTKYNTVFAICGPRYWDEDSEEPIPIVQLKVLVNIKELRFADIVIELEEEIVISPTKLQISNVFFRKKGSNLYKICVNEFFDFSKSKEIVMAYEDDDYEIIDAEEEENNKATIMVLEMNRNAEIKLEYLRLSNITLKNFRKCTWTVNHLYLKNMFFTKSSNMEIKEITLCSCQVNISVLPPSIEKLTINEIRQTNCLCSQPTVLHNLTTMILDFGINSQIIQFLQSRKFKCPFLVELHLAHNSDSLKEIQLTWIPQTLKTLRLTKICINDEGMDCNVSLDKLILCDYDPDQLGNICGTHIRTTNLVLPFLSKPITNRKMVDGFLYFLNNQNICHGTDRRIYVGEVNWTSENSSPNILFRKSPLKHYVDRQANYYLFKNQVGKAITSEEFKIAMT